MRVLPIVLVSASIAVPSTISACSQEAADTPRASVAAAQVAPAPSAAAPQTTDAWVEYQVTGDVTVSGREEDVVMCANTNPGFKARTLGNWYFTIEADEFRFGQHEADFSVTAPVDVIPRDRAGGVNYRLEGTGRITLADAGTGQMNLSLVTVEFVASRLVSDQGRTINVQGTLSCPLF